MEKRTFQNKMDLIIEWKLLRLGRAEMEVGGWGVARGGRWWIMGAGETSA